MRERERELLHRLRGTAAITVLALLVLLVISDVFGRLFLDRDFHVSEVIFGTLAGALLILLGIEGAARILNGNNR